MKKTVKTQKPTGTTAAVAQQLAQAHATINLFLPTPSKTGPAKKSRESQSSLFRRAAKQGPVNNSQDTHDRMWEEAVLQVMTASEASQVTSDLPARFALPLRALNAGWDAKGRELFALLRRQASASTNGQPEATA